MSQSKSPPKTLDNGEVYFSWAKEQHEQIAAKKTPPFPYDLMRGKDLLNWTLAVRPTIDGRINFLRFIPYWQQIMADTHAWIMLLIARQMMKSTYAVSEIGHMLTAYETPKKLTYVTYEDEALSVFSNDKFRDAFLLESPFMKFTIRGATNGALTHVHCTNMSNVRFVTALHNFKHIEGKSVDELIFDEIQNMPNLESWTTAREAQSFTHGKFKCMGIGGWEGTEHHKWWLSTDQRKFKWSHENWREKLQFRQGEGLVWDSYMLDVLAGFWNPEKPENGTKHGYHLSQYDAPWIPLKKSDCAKYCLEESESLQFKEEHTPQPEFIRHIKAGFVAGDIKPFTEQLLQALYVRNIDMLAPDEVDHNQGPLYLGIDYGGGNRTVWWIYQAVDQDIPILRLVNVKRVATSDTNEQYEELKAVMDDYRIKQAVQDAGGGTHQMQELEKRYGWRCLKFSYLTRPNDPKPDAKELDTCYRENRMMYDKTWLMESTIDLMKRPFLNGSQIINRVIFPAKDISKIEWVIDQFTNEQTERVALSKTGTFYTRYFTPDKEKKPDDALQAQNFAFVAWMVDKQRGRRGSIATGTMGGRGRR